MKQKYYALQTKKGESTTTQRIPDIKNRLCSGYFDRGDSKKNKYRMQRTTEKQMRTTIDETE